MFKNRCPDFLIVVNICKLTDQLFQTVPFTYFIWQNILCSSWYLIAHFITSSIHYLIILPENRQLKIKTRHQQRTSGTRYHLISLTRSAALPLTQAVYDYPFPDNSSKVSGCATYRRNSHQLFLSLHYISQSLSFSSDVLIVYSFPLFLSILYFKKDNAMHRPFLLFY